MSLHHLNLLPFTLTAIDGGTDDRSATGTPSLTSSFPIWNTLANATGGLAAGFLGRHGSKFGSLFPLRKWGDQFIFGLMVGMGVTLVESSVRNYNKLTDARASDNIAVDCIIGGVAGLAGGVVSGFSLLLPPLGAKLFGGSVVPLASVLVGTGLQYLNYRVRNTKSGEIL